MKLTMETSKLLGALDSLQRVFVNSELQPNSAYIQNSDVLITATDDKKVTFERHDQGLYSIYSSEATDVEEAGSCIINSGYITGLKIAKKPETTLSTKGKTTMSITAGSFHGELTTGEDQTKITEGRYKDKEKIPLVAKVSAKILAEGCKLTNYSPVKSAGTILPCTIQVSKEELKVSTADSYCTALYTHKFDDTQIVKIAKGKESVQVSIPSKFITGALSQTDGESVSIGMNDDVIRIKLENMEIFHPAKVFDVFNVDEFRAGFTDDKKELEFDVDPSSLEDAILTATSPIRDDPAGFVRVSMTLTKGKNQGIIETESGQSKGKEVFELSISNLTLKEKTTTILMNDQIISQFLRLLSTGHKGSSKFSVIDGWLLLSCPNVSYTMPPIQKE